MRQKSYLLMTSKGRMADLQPEDKTSRSYARDVSSTPGGAQGSTHPLGTARTDWA